MAGSGIYRKCGYTSYACCFLVFVPPFNAIVDVFPAGIGQKHRPVIGFPGFHGAQALYLCLSVFEQRGGDLRGERLAPFLKKSVILPHDKLADPVSAVIVFLALVDSFAAAGTLADSRKKQEQNFMAASKLAQQAKKRFVPIVGYGYGKKKVSNRGLPKFYMELAGKDFWTELTGDEEFYIKLIRFMDKLPEKYVEEFDASYQKAANRLVREFTQEFCFEDGSINWEKLVEFNSGN